MKVSAVVCAFSCERYNYLRETIQSLCDQVFPLAEIVIVIDGSKSLYRQLTSDVTLHKWSNVKLIFNEDLKGLSYARNIGIKETKGDVVALIDDDAMADPLWTQAMVATFKEDGRIGAITGSTVPRFEKDGSWLPKELYWMISCSDITMGAIHEVERCFGTNLAFRRAVLDQVGLFDERLGIQGKKWIGGDDTELVWRVKQAGFKIVCNPDVKVLHAIPAKRLKFNALVKRGFVGGVSEGHMIRITGQQVSPGTRQNYLSTLFFEFFPKRIREAIVHRSRIALIQSLLVATIVIYWGFGFFYGFLT